MLSQLRILFSYFLSCKQEGIKGFYVHSKQKERSKELLILGRKVLYEVWSHRQPTMISWLGFFYLRHNPKGSGWCRNYIKYIKNLLVFTGERYILWQVIIIISLALFNSIVYLFYCKFDDCWPRVFLHEVFLSHRNLGNSGVLFYFFIVKP